MFSSDQLIIFSHFKVSCIDPELTLSTEFSHEAVTTGNLKSISKQRHCLVAIPKNVGADPITGDQLTRPPVMYGLLMDDIVKMRRNSCRKFYMPQNQNCHRDKYIFF